MTKAHPSTAILYFSRSLELEVRNKTLLTKKSQNFSCIRALHEHSFDIIKKSGLPVFHFEESQQKGDSFGERISNAFKDLFDEGYSQIISVGNDCPDLAIGDINDAVANLSLNDIVLGPDQHGGAFLIGLSKDSFDYEGVKNLNWQSDQLISSFEAFASLQKKNFTFIDAKADLNNNGDVAEYSSISEQLALILKKIFFEEHFLKLLFVSLYFIQASGRNFHRGPPTE